MKKHYLIILIVLLIGSYTYANPYMPDLYSSKSNGVIWILVASTSLMIEYLIVRILLSPQVKFRRAISSFLVINLITFPFTQILGQFIVWFAELFPLICEPLMYENRLKDIEVPNLRLKIVSANLVSFILGILLYQLIPILHRQYYS